MRQGQAGPLRRPYAAIVVGRRPRAAESVATIAAASDRRLRQRAYLAELVAAGLIDPRDSQLIDQALLAAGPDEPAWFADLVGIGWGLLAGHLSPGAARQLRESVLGRARTELLSREAAVGQSAADAA